MRVLRFLCVHMRLLGWNYFWVTTHLSVSSLGKWVSLNSSVMNGQLPKCFRFRLSDPLVVFIPRIIRVEEKMNRQWLEISEKIFCSCSSTSLTSFMSQFSSPLSLYGDGLYRIVCYFIEIVLINFTRFTICCVAVPEDEEEIEKNMISKYTPGTLSISLNQKNSLFSHSYVEREC